LAPTVLVGGSMDAAEGIFITFPCVHALCGSIQT
jgi:hypothetical protein